MPPVDSGSLARRYFVRHELARAAVASGLSPARRRELELKVLNALAERGDVDAARLAHLRTMLVCDAVQQATADGRPVEIAALDADRRGAGSAEAGDGYQDAALA